MKATKEFLSLETAELLKDCGIESKYVLIEHCDEGIMDYFIAERGVYRGDEGELGYYREIAPAFSWGEIEDNSEVFFNNEYLQRSDVLLDNIVSELAILRRQKKYNEADKYFRKNCILINNK